MGQPHATNKIKKQSQSNYCYCYEEISEHKIMNNLESTTQIWQTPIKALSL